MASPTHRQQREAIRELVLHILEAGEINQAILTHTVVKHLKVPPFQVRYVINELSFDRIVVAEVGKPVRLRTPEDEDPIPPF